MKIAAFGRTHWLYDSIRALHAAGHEIVLIGTAQAAPEYRVEAHDFVRLGDEVGCECFVGARLHTPDRMEQFRASGAEIGVSVNWPTLIPRQVLTQFRHGVLNAHAGDLPRFRGNAVPNWAILLGESQVVATVHFMTTELDAGDVLVKRALPIDETSNIGSIYEFLETNIPEMMCEAVTGLETGSVRPRPQSKNADDSLRCFPRAPEDGMIDWTKSCDEIDRLVRASSEPFNGAFTYFQSKRLTIWRARTGSLGYPHVGVPGQVVEVSRASGEIAVLTGDGTLVLEEVTWDGGERCRPTDITSSTRSRLGLNHALEYENLCQRIDRLEQLVNAQHLVNVQQ